MIDAKMYSRINDNDFRKRWWKAPKGSILEGKTDFLTSANPRYGYFGAWLPTYAAAKFRPGEGNTDDVNLAASTAYPLMRVEEMYFIEAEAAEHMAAGTGKALLETFINTYRLASDTPEGSQYTCTATDVIDEIVFQNVLNCGEKVSLSSTSNAWTWLLTEPTREVTSVLPDSSLLHAALHG